MCFGCPAGCDGSRSIGETFRGYPRGCYARCRPDGAKGSVGGVKQGFRSQARCTPAYLLNAPNGAAWCCTRGYSLGAPNGAAWRCTRGYLLGAPNGATWYITRGYSLGAPNGAAALQSR